MRVRVTQLLPNLSGEETDSLVEKYLKWSRRSPYTDELFDEPAVHEPVKLAQVGILPGLYDVLEGTTKDDSGNTDHQSALRMLRQSLYVTTDLLAELHPNSHFADIFRGFPRTDESAEFIRNPELAAHLVEKLDWNMLRDAINLPKRD